MVGEIVDRMMKNPANDLFRGYYPFIRRMILPTILIIIFILLMDLSNGSMAISAIFTGFSVGPVLLLERVIIIYLIKQKNMEN